MPKPTKAKSPKRPNRKILTVIGLFAVMILAHVGLSLDHVAASHNTSTKINSVKAMAATTEPANKTLTSSSYDPGSDINALIANNSQDRIGIAVISSQTKLTTYGDTGQFYAASLGKLFSATDYLTKVQTGKASLSQNIDGDTAQDWLQAMIVNSDNTAWEEINEYLTTSDITSYSTNLGLNYNADNNMVDASDIASLLQKLYYGDLLDSSNRNLLLSYMKQANYREYIVPAVPSGDTVYHKVGLYDDTVSDAAIITNGQKSFIVVILTDGQGTYNWTARAQLMQQITQDLIKAYL